MMLLVLLLSPELEFWCSYTGEILSTHTQQQPSNQHYYYRNWDVCFLSHSSVFIKFNRPTDGRTPGRRIWSRTHNTQSGEIVRKSSLKVCALRCVYIIAKKYHPGSIYNGQQTNNKWLDDLATVSKRINKPIDIDKKSERSITHVTNTPRRPVSSSSSSCLHNNFI
jgi:hypothetical protein